MEQDGTTSGLDSVELLLVQLGETLRLLDAAENAWADWVVTGTSPSRELLAALQTTARLLYRVLAQAGVDADPR